MFYMQALIQRLEVTVSTQYQEQKVTRRQNGSGSYVCPMHKPLTQSRKANIYYNNYNREGTHTVCFNISFYNVIQMP